VQLARRALVKARESGQNQRMAACAQCGADLPDGARFCPSCGAPATTPPADERKLATVLFADLVGSTALAGSQDPERTRATLERFYDTMAAEIERAGGTVEKFAGDAVMAVFGAPLALEDHAERALHCALAMRRRLHALFGGELSLRIGVNTGEVVVGRPREGSSFVTGDAVNVCARLEQAAAAQEILVGERTASLVRGAFDFGETRRVQAKGKEDGVLGTPLVGALSLMRPRGVGGVSRAFVGRDVELDLLLATYGRTVEQAAPHVVTIMADAGVGKTRLVRELWEWLTRLDPEPLRRTGRCLAYGHGITYWPLGEILKEHLGILESDPPEVVRERLGGRDILGLALGLDTGGELHPLAARDRLHDAWVELLSELVAERPVVMLLEDLHWAEEPLLELVERLARDVRGPLLVIGTARPELLEARPSWSGGLRNASQVWLEPLRAEHAAAMVDGLLGAELPAGMRHEIVARAEGNPFFVEELISTLIDHGVLARCNGSWAVTDAQAKFDIPDTVHAVVAARIDLLPRAEKAALQAAAVAGRVFWEGPVIELLDGTAPDFQLLETRDFIRRVGASTMDGEREFAIKHTVTREVAYASVPKARRARLHAAFAEWLEKVGAGRDEHAPLLAHHYEQSVATEHVDLAWGDEPAEAERLRSKAATWLRRAGELAVARYDLDEGIVLLQRAVELEPDQNARSELWREIGRANALGFHGAEFWEAMERSLELTDDERVRGETYAELAYQTSFRSGMWMQAPERDVVDGWIEKAIALSEPDSAARATALCAKVFWSPRAEPEAAEESSRIADATGNPELRSSAYFARSMAAHHARRYEEALEWVQKPLEFVDDLTDPEKVAEVYEAVVPPDAALGRFADARAMAHAFDAATARLTPHHRVHGIALTVEIEELASGWETVRTLTARVERAVEANLATPCVRNQRTLLACAAAARILGDEAESERLEQRGEALGMEGYDLMFGGPRLRLALLKGDTSLIEQQTSLLANALLPNEHRYWFVLPTYDVLFDGLIEVGDRAAVEAFAEPLLEPPGTCLEALARRALGRVRSDRSDLETALARFEAMGLERHAQQTRDLLTA
jgi:class 3 adenylate cyclase/tetratricopeptide (TPR) repeat protein